MMFERNLFTPQLGIEQGRRLRDDGIERVCSYPNDLWINQARALALKHAQQHGSVTGDDIHRYIDDGFLDTPSHPNAFGGIFRTKPFKFSGEWKQSERPDRHGAFNRVWRAA